MTVGWPDYIFGQFRNTARCRDAQQGDGVCCAFAPQLVISVLLFLLPFVRLAVNKLLSVFVLARIYSSKNFYGTERSFACWCVVKETTRSLTADRSLYSSHQQRHGLFGCASTGLFPFSALSTCFRQLQLVCSHCVMKGPLHVVFRSDYRS